MRGVTSVGLQVMWMLVLMVVHPVQAWWDNGHMLTAEIARQQLTKDEVDALNDIFADWSKDFPGVCDIVNVSVWPDMIKCQKPSELCQKKPSDAIHAFDDWHFANKAWNPDNIPLPGWAKGDGWTRDPSAVWFLVEAMDTFGSSGSRFAFNLMGRLFIHILGDAHQPLHVADGFFNDKQYGNLKFGDEGGNGIFVKTDWLGVTNLHALWDSGIGLYLQHWPLDSSALTKNASAITTKYPKDSPVFAGRYNSDELAPCWDAVQEGSRSSACLDVFEKWANQSLAIAAKDVYPGITNHGEVPSDYIAKNRAIVQQLLALGGYRLADALRMAISRAPQLKAKQIEASNDLGVEWTMTAKTLLCVSIGLGCFSLILLHALVSRGRKVQLLNEFQPSVRLTGQKSPV